MQQPTLSNTVLFVPSAFIKRTARVAEYAILVPSGDHTGFCAHAPLVNCTGFDPLLFMTHISAAPLRHELNTIFEPSGDHLA